jgi:hypothetical protein
MVTDKPEAPTFAPSTDPGAATASEDGRAARPFRQQREVGRDTITAMTDAKFAEPWHFKTRR